MYLLVVWRQRNTPGNAYRIHAGSLFISSTTLTTIFSDQSNYTVLHSPDEVV